MTVEEPVGAAGLPGADVIADAAAGVTWCALALALHPLARLPALAQGWWWQAPPPAAEVGAVVAAGASAAALVAAATRVGRALDEAPVAALGPLGALVAVGLVALRALVLAVDVESRLLVVLLDVLWGLPALVAALLAAATLARAGLGLPVWALRALAGALLVVGGAELLGRVFLGDLAVAGLAGLVWGALVAGAGLTLAAAAVSVLGGWALRAPPG